MSKEEQKGEMDWQTDSENSGDEKEDLQAEAKKLKEQHDLYRLLQVDEKADADAIVSFLVSRVEKSLPQDGLAAPPRQEPWR